jgi:hypothetical protein
VQEQKMPLNIISSTLFIFVEILFKNTHIYIVLLPHVLEKHVKETIVSTMSILEQNLKTKQTLLRIKFIPFLGKILIQILIH